MYSKDEILYMFRLAAEEINGFSIQFLHFNPEERVQESDLIVYSSWVKRLRAGEPLQYVSGNAWFCGLELHVNNHVLIPRPETEELVNYILENGPVKNASILDVCTGSGCIALALKHYLPHSVVTATDISAGALQVAEANAKRLQLECSFVQKDFLKSWSEFSSGSWDVIVSNPPYIPESFKQTIQNQVLQEPHEALFVQDAQALIFYEALGMLAVGSLKDGGLLIAECHFDKTNEVSELWRSRFGLECVQLDDLQGVSRFVLGKKESKKNFNQIKTEL